MASAIRALRRMAVLAAAVVSVAGCVGMPSNGPGQEATASPQSPAPNPDVIVPNPSGPLPGDDPSDIVADFLVASASYPTYTVAREYLTGQAGKTWSPTGAVTVYSNLSFPNAVVAGKGAQQATVDVTGTVQALFDGSGQYVSAQSRSPVASGYHFDLTKVGGQWRISNPPVNRMLTTDTFSIFYRAQDLYFAGPQDNVLVPDSVFVPQGAPLADQLFSLVSALAVDPATTSWLEGAANSALPARSTVLSVTPVGSTVTVNLGGQAAAANGKQLSLFSAQLLWTLTGLPANLPTIQSIVLEINGHPWTPSTPLCPGELNPASAQTLAAYECLDPYPSAPAGFYYVDRGQGWARCGTEAQAESAGLIGSVVPIVDHTGIFTGPPCASGYVPEGATAPPAKQPASLPAASMVSVSPDGKYLALVTADGGAVYIGTMSGQAVSFPAKPRWTGADITDISWDRGDDLWVVQNGGIVMLPGGSGGEVTVQTLGSVSDLSVAPDGVRIAFIAQSAGAAAPALYLAAIGAGQQSTGQLGAPSAHLAIRDVASLGPNLTHPASLTWYDADNLLVVNDAPGDNTLWEAPVDGQRAQLLSAAALPTMTSVTADGPANVVVLGLSGNSLYVSASLAGPWNQLGVPGQNPAYPGR